MGGMHSHHGHALSRGCGRPLRASTATAVALSAPTWVATAVMRSAATAVMRFAPTGRPLRPDMGRVLRRDCGRALRPELGVHGYIHLCSHWSRKPAPLAVFTPATDHLLKPTGLQQQGASRALWSSSLAVGMQCINHGCRKTSLSTVTKTPWFSLVFVIRASQERQQYPSVPLAPDGLGTATQSLVFVIRASQEDNKIPLSPLHLTASAQRRNHWCLSLLPAKKDNKIPLSPLHLTAPARRRGTECKHKGFMVVHVPQRSVRRIIEEFGATILSAPPRRSRSFAIAEEPIECYQPC